MDKLEEYDVRTMRMTFTLEMFEDSNQGEFVGKLTSFSPPLPQQSNGSTPMPYMEVDDYGEIRDRDRDRLIELCKKRMSELGGDIIFFVESKKAASQ